MLFHISASDGNRYEHLATQPPRQPLAQLLRTLPPPPPHPRRAARRSRSVRHRTRPAAPPPTRRMDRHDRLRRPRHAPVSRGDLLQGGGTYARYGHWTGRGFGRFMAEPALFPRQSPLLPYRRHGKRTGWLGGGRQKRLRPYAGGADDVHAHRRQRQRMARQRPDARDERPHRRGHRHCRRQTPTAEIHTDVAFHACRQPDRLQQNDCRNQQRQTYDARTFGAEYD